MYEFTPFKKTDKLSYESFIQFPRELLKREEYKGKRSIKTRIETFLKEM